MASRHNYRLENMDGILGRGVNDSNQHWSRNSGQMGRYKAFLSRIKAMKYMNCTINFILISQIIFFIVVGFFAVRGWTETARQNGEAIILIHLTTKQLGEFEI